MCRVLQITCVMFCKKGEADIVCNVVQICGGVLLIGVEFSKLCGHFYFSV